MSELTQKTYWKSLNELAQNKEYEKFVEREFPENATELKDGVSRKGFLRIMGASIALAGFAACRRPVQKILPYSKQPEDIVPGIPLFYASAMPFQGSLTGLVVENHAGRPTKVEGNDLHPASGGNTNAFHQASILEMYDPDRSRTPMRNGAKSSTDDFYSFVSEYFADTNKRVAFISEANSSPTYNGLKEEALNRFDNAEWVTYEPFGEDNAIEGNNIAFGQRVRTHYNFTNADIIVSLDDDFLAPTHPNNVEYAKQVTSRRKVTSQQDSMSRIYSVENGFTVTGSYADHRLRIKASEMADFANALANALSGKVTGLSNFSSVNNKFTGSEFVTVLADDLANNAGRSAVSLGFDFAPEVHAVVAAINSALNNYGTTVNLLQVPHIDDLNNKAAFADLVNSIRGGNFDAVVIIGANPALTAPSDLNFVEALSGAEEVIQISTYNDETAKATSWHVPRAHYLEAWGDGYSFGGARAVIQPQIQPLHDSLSEIEFLGAITQAGKVAGYDLVRSTFNGYYRSEFENRWLDILHDGIDVTNGFSVANRSIRSVSPAPSTSINDIEVVIKADNSVYDGRFSNLGWLQELPDPITKITWDNVALISPNTAEKLGISTDDYLGKADQPILNIAVNGTPIKIAAWVQPGHADDSITVHTGYGREGIGRVADVSSENSQWLDPSTTSGGVNVYPIRTTSSMLFAQAGVSVTNETYPIACVQDHHSLEGRDMYRQATLAEYKETADYASFKKVHKYAVPGMKEAAELGEDQPISLFNEQTAVEGEPQWGMAIDLNACFGCGVCIIACQSENNIPVIGKREVERGREMHWIRTDRYYMGDKENPQAVHQPVPCMHCELAPCEQVCPVAATTHSDDGMNQMTYNRCIGTRYCANNCPFKVRRFNFFNYPKEYLTTGEDPDIIQMAMNPEVTVRFRGVMEKCTYCVQRVNREKISAKIETGSPKPADGTVQTACQQACPADAIYFGDLTDEGSEVSKMKRNERNYLMLEELNVRPRTSYIAKLTNPNPALVKETNEEYAK
ncbi:MAG: TAT-variant-translocated molybdopterin oxidoreductase [bacterium]|nr:TAT-variant-translocated molybdopterin oxidoreductase [bacterium]